MRYVKANITKVDPENRTVETDKGKFTYDYLIASLGIENDFKTYNLGVGGYHNFSLDGALKLREALRSFSGGNVVVFTPEPIYRCGVYPFEIVGQLDTVFRKRGIRDKVNITLIHPFEKPIQPLGPEAAKITMEVFKQKGINYVGNARPVEVDDKNKTVVITSDKVKYDLLIVVPPPPGCRSHSRGGRRWWSIPRWASGRPLTYTRAGVPSSMTSTCRENTQCLQ